jgi:hypothetical protein
LYGIGDVVWAHTWDIAKLIHIVFHSQNKACETTLRRFTQDRFMTSFDWV